MNFASSIFLFWFLPCVLAAYRLIPARRIDLRNGLLTLASVVFYGWWMPRFLPLLLFSAAVDYGIGLRLEATSAPGRRKLLLATSCVVNLGLLAVFKYSGLAAATWGDLCGSPPPEWLVRIGSVVLPVGISFYTFQTLGYAIDVYRRTTTAARSFPDFLCFVALFPQLVAGPIVRYTDIAAELKSRTTSPAALSTGAFFFMAGFVKKVLIADTLAGPADLLFGPTSGAAAPLSEPTFLEAAAGVLAYAGQIYFDFSGYSDMAIGLGLAFGFRFPLNFDAPYRATSLTDFWRRWHMTLSSWLRDYLYIPLGGDRRGAFRTYFNLAATMLLGGLWHGAAWTFVAWGAFHAFWLGLERALGRRALWSAAPAWMRATITFVVVALGWVFFRARDFGDAAAVFSALAGRAGLGAGVGRLGLGGEIFTPLVLAAAAVVVVKARTTAEAARSPGFEALLVPVLFAWSVLHLLFQSDSPFLYFRF